MDIILGSASPRRKELLSLIFSDFSIFIPDIDESPNEGEEPLAYCKRISLEKNRFCLEEIHHRNDYLLLTSDTTVVADRMILGKPVDRLNAVKMLQLLSGREHSVITSVTMTYKKGERTESLTDIQETIVFFRDLSSKTIDNYLDTISWHDKAGSYAIQDSGHLIVEKTEGSLSNVIGLPMGLVITMIQEMGLWEKLLTGSAGR